MFMSKAERESLRQKKTATVCDGENEREGEWSRLCVCGCIPARPQPPEQIWSLSHDAAEPRQKQAADLVPNH